MSQTSKCPIWGLPEASRITNVTSHSAQKACTYVCCGHTTFACLVQSGFRLKKAVLHELPHLRYPNHSKMFNLMLETRLKKRLRLVNDAL